MSERTVISVRRLVDEGYEVPAYLLEERFTEPCAVLQSRVEAELHSGVYWGALNHVKEGLRWYGSDFFKPQWTEIVDFGLDTGGLEYVVEVRFNTPDRRWAVRAVMPRGHVLARPLEEMRRQREHELREAYRKLVNDLRRDLT